MSNFYHYGHVKGSQLWFCDSIIIALVALIPPNFCKYTPTVVIAASAKGASYTIDICAAPHMLVKDVSFISWYFGRSMQFTTYVSFLLLSSCLCSWNLIGTMIALVCCCVVKKTTNNPARFLIFRWCHKYKIKSSSSECYDTLSDDYCTVTDELHKARCQNLIQCHAQNRLVMQTAIDKNWIG